MKQSNVLIPVFVFMSLAPFSASYGAEPAWWSSRGVINTSPASNLSPATIGQAKWMVAQALAELQSRLIPADYQALAADVAAVANLAAPQNAGEFESQRAVLLVGQLKSMAKPFYVRLRVINASWLDAQMQQAATRQVVPGSYPVAYSLFPWTESTADDKNYAPATLGQLKAVFSLRFEDLGTTPLDSDGDGISDAVEIAQGTSPTLADSDGDGYPDSVDAYPLDPTKHALPSSVSGDTTKPVVTLDAPASAIYVSGP